MLTKAQFTELANLLCSICNSHSAKTMNHYWYENEKYCRIEVKADSIDTIVDMNFDLAEKITANTLLENCDFTIVFEPYKEEVKMSLSQEIEKIVKQTIQDYFASQKQEMVLDGNTVIKGTLKVKPITGSIIGFRDGKPIFRE